MNCAFYAGCGSNGSINFENRNKQNKLPENCADSITTRIDKQHRCKVSSTFAI